MGVWYLLHWCINQYDLNSLGIKGKVLHSRIVPLNGNWGRFYFEECMYKPIVCCCSNRTIPEEANLGIGESSLTCIPTEKSLFLFYLKGTKWRTETKWPCLLSTDEWVLGPVLVMPCAIPSTCITANSSQKRFLRGQTKMSRNMITRVNILGTNAECFEFWLDIRL